MNSNNVYWASTQATDKLSFLYFTEAAMPRPRLERFLRPIRPELTMKSRKASECNGSLRFSAVTQGGSHEVRSSTFRFPLSEVPELSSKCPTGASFVAPARQNVSRRAVRMTGFSLKYFCASTRDGADRSGALSTDEYRLADESCKERVGALFHSELASVL
jgi:hypothetical protein